MSDEVLCVVVITEPSERGYVMRTRGKPGDEASVALYQEQT